MKLVALLHDLALSVVYLLAGAFLLGLLLGATVSLFLVGLHAGF